MIDSGFTKATNEESSHNKYLGTFHGQKIGLDVGVMRGVACTLLALEDPNFVFNMEGDSLQNDLSTGTTKSSKLSANCKTLLDLCSQIKATGYLPGEPLFELIDKARKKYRMVCALAKIVPNVGPELASPVAQTAGKSDEKGGGLNVDNSF